MMLISKIWCQSSMVVLALLVSAPLAHSQSLQSDSSQTSNQTKENSDRFDPQTPYRISGRFHLQKGTTQGYLVLQCELQSGNHIYSLTQTGALKPTQIRVVPSSDFTIKGEFNPDQPPIVVENDPVFNQRLEKHKGTVRFFVPFEVGAHVNVEDLQPELVIDGQVCSEKGFCMQLREKTVKAEFSGYFERTSQRQGNSQNVQSN